MTNQLGCRCLIAAKANCISNRAKHVAAFLSLTHSAIAAPEVLLDLNSHILRYETGGLSANSRAQAFPIKAGECGYITAEQVLANLHLEVDVHNANTALITLEVPMAGVIMPFEEIKKISVLARSKGVLLHLDGARLWNASVATGIPMAEYCALFDTVSLCLSKGLGAPIGSVLVSSKQHIHMARHWRKQMGGGWRQAGLLAAAGIYAIDHNWPSMKQDHANAKYLAEQLQNLGCKVTPRVVETNIFFVDTTALSRPGEYFAAELKKKGVVILSSSSFSIRVVVHLQTPREAIDAFVTAFSEACKRE